MTLYNPTSSPPGAFLKKATRVGTAAAGDVAYTGVGFRPVSLYALGSLDTPPGHCIGCGGGSGVTNTVIYMDGGLLTFVYDETYLLYFLNAAGNYQRAFLKTLDADGFTLTWSKSVTGVSDIHFVVLCLG